MELQRNVPVPATLPSGLMSRSVYKALSMNGQCVGGNASETRIDRGTQKRETGAPLMIKLNRKKPPKMVGTNKEQYNQNTVLMLNISCRCAHQDVLLYWCIHPNEQWAVPASFQPYLPFSPQFVFF
jgi:hypothetical protein